MVKLNHIRLAVKDYRAARDWYVRHFAFRLEFEVPRRGVAGLRDDDGMTLILEQTNGRVASSSCVLYFEVKEVKAEYRRLAEAGVRFVHRPMKRFWGYGAELKDPSGYRVRLWDEASMEERG